jgi:hypothetical protein
MVENDQSADGGAMGRRRQITIAMVVVAAMACSQAPMPPAAAVSATTGAGTALGHAFPFGGLWMVWIDINGTLPVAGNLHLAQASFASNFFDNPTLSGTTVDGIAFFDTCTGGVSITNSGAEFDLNLRCTGAKGGILLHVAAAYDGDLVTGAYTAGAS